MLAPWTLETESLGLSPYSTIMSTSIPLFVKLEIIIVVTFGSCYKDKVS